MKKADKNTYWEVVGECLLKFHGIEDSRKFVELFRDEIGKNEIIYHAEPFDVACDITGRALDSRAYLDEYNKICEKFGW